jgi:hypothetical protein
MKAEGQREKTRALGTEAGNGNGGTSSKQLQTPGKSPQRTGSSSSKNRVLNNSAMQPQATGSQMGH